MMDYAFMNYTFANTAQSERFKKYLAVTKVTMYFFTKVTMSLIKHVFEPRSATTQWLGLYLRKLASTVIYPF